MATRLTLYVFRGPSEIEFREAMESIVADLVGQLDWETHPLVHEANLLTSHGQKTHSAMMSRNGHEIASGIAKRRGIPWMELRIQEGALWDYSLFDGSNFVHKFSTLPEYWDDEPSFIKASQGNPKELARLWKVPLSTIENYLRHWGYILDEEDGSYEIKLRGKAYPADQFEYGQIWQMTDFLRALGVQYPGGGPPLGIARKLVFKE